MSFTAALYVIGGLILILDCALWFRRDAGLIRPAHNPVLEHS